VRWCATRERPASTVRQLPGLLKARWPEIEHQLLQGRYQPQPVRRVQIPKPAGGARGLGIPTVIDRVIQQAVLQRLQPLWDPTFARAKAAIEARAKERHARERAEYEAKMAARNAKAAQTDKKPGGRVPQPPVEGPLPTDQVNLTDATAISVRPT
jgi:hypothetical protein